MVRIDRVVTRGGDGGETSLGDGSRLPKTDPRIEAIGSVDETNAAIGVLRAHLPATPQPSLTDGLPAGIQPGRIDAMLARIQNDLFDLGADLCVPGQAGDRLRMGDAETLRLEREVEAMNAALPPLTSFVLPGGSPSAAHAHMARTICRRTERAVLGVAGINPALSRYLNRLSDHLFVLARVLNDNGAADIPWTPGANRGTDAEIP